jgi:hypothetical protein
LNERPADFIGFRPGTRAEFDRWQCEERGEFARDDRFDRT